MLEVIAIEHYLNELKSVPLVDVRSPSEHEKGHIPGAINIPIFDDQERAVIGTAYKNESKERAMEIGLEYAQPKFEHYVAESLKVAPNKIIAIHCWRGGMRSKAFAQHLVDNGFERVFQIEKGYKAFRNLAHSEFEKECDLKIIGGYTGSAKTEILNHIKNTTDIQVVDLERIANHKGSSFGGIDQGVQPTVEQFENNLFWEWKELDLEKEIWIEDESRAIGAVMVPEPLYMKIRSQHVYFIDIPRMERSKFLVEGYGSSHINELKDGILRISKRLGGLNTKNAIQLLEEGNLVEVASLALKYYDKYYEKGVSKRDKSLVTRIKLETTNPIINSEEILKIVHEK